VIPHETQVAVNVPIFPVPPQHVPGGEVNCKCTSADIELWSAGNVKIGFKGAPTHISTISGSDHVNVIITSSAQPTLSTTKPKIPGLT